MTKKSKPEEKPQINIYRITYRLRNGQVPLMAEMIIRSRKEETEINFEEVIKNYWKTTPFSIELDQIVMINKIGKESQK